MAFIEASLEELPVSANLGQSCLATKISAPGPSIFWVVPPQLASELVDSLPEMATSVSKQQFKT